MLFPKKDPLACRHLKDELFKVVKTGGGTLYVLMRCCDCGMESTFQVDRAGYIQKVHAA
jgi:hypothetical protein